MRAVGRVLLAGETDSTPLAGTWVVLHAVTMQAGGPADSARTDAAGRYRMAVARADSAALYMVSATYRGITYFSEAMHARQVPDTIPALIVFDTSSVAPIAVGQRHVVVRGAGQGGRRNVLELVTLVNLGTKARIAGDSTRPVWGERLPRGVADFRVGQSDVSAEAVAQVGDSVLVTAPVPPGQKQVVFTYTVPAGNTLRLPLDQSADRMLVLLEDTAATIAGGPLVRRGVEAFEDTHFALFDGTVPPGGGEAVFRLAGGGGLGSKTVVTPVVAVVAVILLLALARLRNRGVPLPVAVGPETPETLARQIALLDHAFEQGPRTPQAEAAYQAQRAQLKARLADLLAGRGAGA